VKNMKKFDERWPNFPFAEFISDENKDTVCKFMDEINHIINAPVRKWESKKELMKYLDEQGFYEEQIVFDSQESSDSLAILNNNIEEVYHVVVIPVGDYIFDKVYKFFPCRCIVKRKDKDYYYEDSPHSVLLCPYMKMKEDVFIGPMYFDDELDDDDGEE